ncbi:MAG: hypothetical protein WCB67_08050 [Solirubrobacteraceae bacterium]
MRAARWPATAFVAVVYSAYAIFLTWPLATNPGGLMPGFDLYGDQGAGVAQITYLFQHHVFPFAPATLHAVNAPYGAAVPWLDNLASFPGTGLVFGLSYVFGAVAASAVFLWLGFVLSGMSMFLLTRKLFDNVPAAALAGFAFAFYPFAIHQINGHYVYMEGWILVLAVWRMLEMINRPTRGNALWAGSAAALAMWFTPYFILIAGVAFAALAVLAYVVFVLRGERRAGLRKLLLAAVPIGILLLGLAALTVLAGGTGSGVRTQSVHELYNYTARPVGWLLPDGQNLIFGGLTRGYLTTHLHGSNLAENSLYLGLSVLGLALVGLAIAIRALRDSGRAALRDPAIVAVLAGACLALVAAWFSLPPTLTIFGFPVLMPSGLVYMFTSTWRAYSRFVEVLELGLCIMLAFGVSRLLSRLRSGTALGVTGLLAIVLVVDLWARPPVRTVSTAPPAEYVWLRDHRGGTVADYPILAGDYPDYHGLFWQTFDRHPVIQGYAVGSESEAIKLGLADLRETSTAAGLAALGVKYIVVHPGQPGANQATIRRNHYTVRFSSPSGSVWQVGAPPAPTLVDALDNFSWVQGAPGAEYRWMTGPGVLALHARDCPRSCRGTLTFTSGANKLPRTLTVTDQASGRALARRRIPAWIPVQVTVPDVTLVKGQAHVVLSTDIGPTASAPGIYARSLSVYVREPHLTLGVRRP